MTAIYARQSVDRADSISIESQIDFCRYEARGEPCRTYIDRGFSGKNTVRPAFNELMRDIESGAIRRVIVYKLDRISRSILDFSTMMEHFERRGVEFVSATERFDTSTPMGRAMLNICVVFAQLERETIQKRVADAYFTRSRKSLYMGGRVPYGFCLAPCVVGGVKTSVYSPEPTEAERVRLMFELYAQPGVSCGDIARYFTQHGYLNRSGKPWERARISELLRNPVYVRADMSIYEYFRRRGAVIVNDPGDFIGVNGCYLYRGREGNGRKRADPEGSQLVLAPHEGLVAPELWLACREKSSSPRPSGLNSRAKNTWLSGRIKCGACGYALVDKRYQMRSSRYLLCSHRSSSHACEGPGTLYTDELEALVGAELQKELARFPTLNKRVQGGMDPEETALRGELMRIENEIDALLERLAGADETLCRYIQERVHELDGKKQGLYMRLEASRRREQETVSLRCSPEIWNRLGFEDRRQVAGLLLGAVRASAGRIVIEWRL